MNEWYTVRGRPHLRIHEIDMRRALTVLVVTCPECHKGSQLIVPTQGLGQWVDNALIQDALPTLNDTDREQLITGYCQPCWDKMWAVDGELLEGPPNVA